MTLSILDLHVYASAQDLPQDLAAYVVSVPGSPLSVFKHPLWTDIFPMALPHPIEEVLQRKQEDADEKLDRNDHSGFVFLHERPFRMDVLDHLWSSGTFDHDPKTYWKLARKVWIDSEQDESDDRWTRLLEVPLPERHAMTTKEEWSALYRHPEQLTLYRGVHGVDAEDAESSTYGGWSWTLSEETARFFAQRLRSKGMQGFVAKAHAPRSRVIAHFLSRGESEIVIGTEDIDHRSLTISSI